MLTLGFLSSCDTGEEAGQAPPPVVEERAPQPQAEPEQKGGAAGVAPGQPSPRGPGAAAPGGQPTTPQTGPGATGPGGAQTETQPGGAGQDSPDKGPLAGPEAGGFGTK
jgi:hypothetical protein